MTDTTIQGAKLTLRPCGDANDYTIVNGTDWFARVLMNGEMTVKRQEEWLRLFLAAPLLLEALETSAVGLHAPFHGKPCDCRQCQFVHAKARALAAVKGA